MLFEQVGDYTVFLSNNWKLNFYHVASYRVWSLQYFKYVAYKYWSTLIIAIGELYEWSFKG